MTSADPPDEPPGPEAEHGVQIRTFLIADVRGYTLFTQERGDEAAAKLAARFADIARETVEQLRGGQLLEGRLGPVVDADLAHPVTRSVLRTSMPLL